MSKVLKYWTYNRLFSGFSRGQLLAIYAIAYAIRHGADDDQLRRALELAFRHRPAQERQVMLEAAHTTTEPHPFVVNKRALLGRPGKPSTP